MTAKIGNLKLPVRAAWIRELGCRLDAPPYVSGALEAKKILEALSVRKDNLSSLTDGYSGGIYSGPHFIRNYVDSDVHGVRFLTAGTMLLADLSTLPFLRKRDATSHKLAHLELKPGMTLISCSGTIGRTAYCRSDMEGIWGSQDVIKVNPNPNLVPAGYVFAFLSSKFGMPIVTGSTYGSIIPHLEPEHLFELPIPRFGRSLEQKVHNKIETASRLRAEAGEARLHLRAEVGELIGWVQQPLNKTPSVVPSSRLRRRLDGFYHGRTVDDARMKLANHERSKMLGDLVCEVFEPNRGARRKVDDARFGIPFLSSSSVFRLEPTAEYLISKSSPNLDRLIVKDTDLLLPRSGQLGGIIGRAVMPLSGNIGSAASEHLVRVRCKSKKDAHYLWAILASQAGYYAAIGTAFGTSIPSLDCELLSNLSVPWLHDNDRMRLSNASLMLHGLLADAIVEERAAIALVEQAIEENA